MSKKLKNLPITKNEEQFREIRVLLIDDDVFNRVALKVILNKLPKLCLAIDEACDGGEGLNLILNKNQTYDVIFVDWNMPNVSGKDFI